MAVPLLIRTRINRLIDQEVMRNAVDSGINWTGTRTRMAQVVNRLNTDHGWARRSFINLYNGAEATGTTWESAGVHELKRRWVIQVTRSAEHQARAEASGETAPGANTYECVVNQVFCAKIGARWRENEIEGETVIDEPLVTLGIACVRAVRRGARPANRLRDL
jgi:hypothetical protein